MEYQAEWREPVAPVLAALVDLLADFPVQNLRTLAGLLEELPCGVAILDLDDQLRTISANRAWVDRDSSRRLPKSLASAWSSGQASPSPGWDLYPLLGRPGQLLVVDSENMERKPPAVARLSARECEIVTLVAAGHSNAEIAGQLFLSPATVASHVARILDKLGFRSRVQIAAWASRGLRPGRPSR